MTAQQTLYAAAAFASIASYALHAFGGGALMARPFYAKAAAADIRSQAFRFCWHFVSATLIAIGAGYAFLAFEPQHWPLGVFLTGSAAAYCALSIGVSLIEKSSPLKSPPTTLCAIIAALGAAGLFS